jgi:hypothetical protein
LEEFSSGCQLVQLSLHFLQVGLGLGQLGRCEDFISLSHLKLFLCGSQFPILLSGLLQENFRFMHLSFQNGGESLVRLDAFQGFLGLPDLPDFEFASLNVSPTIFSNLLGAGFSVADVVLVQVHLTFLSGWIQGLKGIGNPHPCGGCLDASAGRCSAGGGLHGASLASSPLAGLTGLTFGFGCIAWPDQHQ